ncbi:MAG: oligosaccharide flippase family protein [Verrucomicrobiae bacterium]|nr:oligosaccharide flippase family protein [Verrucomicrobiae bacterium]
MNAAAPAVSRRWWSQVPRLKQIAELISRQQGEILACLGTFSAPAVNLVYGLLVFRYLTPSLAGILSTAMLLPSYLMFAHGGVLNGMQRELPFALGQGDRTKADHLLRITSTIALLAGGASAFACLVAALIAWTTGKPPLLALAYIGAAFTSFAFPVVMQIDTGLRAENRFRRQGWAVLNTNAVSLAACALLPALGATGAVLRGIVAGAASLLLRLRSGVWSPALPVDWSGTLALARTGWPLLASATLGGWMMIADRSVVSLLMSDEAMGEFQLAGFIVNSMSMVPVSLSLVLFPKIARAYGEHRSRRKLRRFVWISLAFNAATLLPLSGITYLVIEPLVLRFFPKYAAGIPSAHIACLTCVFWIYAGAGSVIGVTNRMTPYLITLGVSLALIWTGAAWLIHSGYGINGAAWARLAGTVLMCVFTVGYSLYLTSRDDEPAEVNGGT